MSYYGELLPEVNFSFIETELPQGVIPAFAGIHNMKLTFKCLDPCFRRDDTRR